MGVPSHVFAYAIFRIRTDMHVRDSLPYSLIFPRSMHVMDQSIDLNLMFVEFAAPH